MNITNAHMQLYAVTDSRWSAGNEEKFLTDIESALVSGITCLQLREKSLDEKAFIARAFKVKALCTKYKIPFIINDNVNIAKAIDADGIHVGQSDLSVSELRRVLGDKIIGVSVHTPEQALRAKISGADYLGVGAMFSTSTKGDASAVTKEVLYDICKLSGLPVVAIGGINADNVSDLYGTGVHGIAVVSAIFGQEDIVSATKDLVKRTEKFGVK